MARRLAFLLAVAVVYVALPAWGFRVPPIAGHVNDLAGALTEDQRYGLERQMREVDRSNGTEIAVLILSSLGGESIEDVAYETFNTWKLGKRGADNGVLLVIATGDRRIRIETGKGVEGNLTDLETQDIITKRIAPELRRGHVHEGVRAGVVAIAAALGADADAPDDDPPAAHRLPSLPFPLLVFIGFLVLFIVSLFNNWRGGGGGGGTGSFTDPRRELERRELEGRGGGGTGGGDGGFSGGGGASGGGGSSASY